MTRFLFGVLGGVFAMIAIVGVWLPGVPTTMPLIIALWAFSKSSVRLRRQLERLPILKTALAEARRFERERSVTRRVKIIAQTSAWLSTIIVGLATQNVVITVWVGGVALMCSIFMYRIATADDKIVVSP